MAKTISEANYLRKQSARAKAEMGKAVRRITDDAGKAANPRRLVQKHPWISLAASLVLGFAARANYCSPPQNRVRRSVTRAGQSGTRVRSNPHDSEVDRAGKTGRKPAEAADRGISGGSSRVFGITG